MDKSKLEDHKWGKGKDSGKLITPMNSTGIMKNDSWVDDRLPEYLWIGLILENSTTREEGFQKIYQILEFLHILEPKITLPCFSEVLSLDPSTQARFFQKIAELTDESILEPLTLILTHNEYPVFAQLFTNSMSDITQRQELLLNIN